MLITIIDLHRMRVSEDAEKQLVLAEADMVVCLEQAHHKSPELPWKTLLMTREVQDYKEQVLADAVALTGVRCDLAVQCKPDISGELYFVVKIILKGDPQ